VAGAAGITPRDTVVFELYWVARKKPREIAELFGLTRAAIQAALTR
jgi:hypothetical protein